MNRSITRRLSTMLAIAGALMALNLAYAQSPVYLHDGRLLTIEDTVEFFNLILGTRLTEQEKQDLVTFLRAL